MKARLDHRRSSVGEKTARASWLARVEGARRAITTAEKVEPATIAIKGGARPRAGPGGFATPVAKGLESHDGWALLGREPPPATGPATSAPSASGPPLMRS